MSDNKTITPIREFFAGCVAGFSKIYTGQPFDIVKVRLQSAQTSTSPLLILNDILKNEGFFALWKGSLPPLLGVGATASLQFGVNENVKKLIIRYNEGAKMSFAQLCLAGGLGGLANCLVSTPAEHFRILMQTQSKENPIYKGSIDCMKKVYHNYGIRGVYKGGVPTICRDTLGYGVYFAAFSTMMQKFHPGQPRTEHSLVKIGVAGSLSGIILWSCVFPFDVVKTKIQTDSVMKPRYNGMVDCFKQVYGSSGVSGFYKGYVPAFLRAIPVNGVVFVLYEVLYRSLMIPTPVFLKSI